MKAESKVVVQTGPRPDNIEVLSLQDVSRMPLARYYKDVAGNIVNSQAAVYYDSAFIAAGTAVTNGMKKALFSTLR